MHVFFKVVINTENFHIVVFSSKVHQNTCNQSIAGLVTVDAATLAGYVGKYALNPTFAIAITADKGHLYAQATGQQRFDLVATAANRFALQGVPAELEFVKNATGATEKLILHQGGVDQTGRRVE